MGADIDNIPWPKRSSKPPRRSGRSGSSGKGNGPLVGMAIMLLALPVASMVGSLAYVIYGHFIGR